MKSANRIETLMSLIKNLESKTALANEKTKLPGKLPLHMILLV
jgi:hypothetical protein